MKNQLKSLLNWKGILSLFVVGVLIYFVHDIEFTSESQPKELAGNIPECQDKAIITADVLLVYVAETHPDNPALPGKYETAVKQLWQTVQTVDMEFKEPDSSLLSKLKSPYPSEFLIGKVLSYNIERKFCKAPTVPIPKKPDVPSKPKKPLPKG